MQLMMIHLDSRREGRTALDSLDRARDTKEIVLEDLALVYRNDRGRVKVDQTSDVGVGAGAVRGGVLGLLLGMISPLGAIETTVAGSTLGSIISGVGDKGLDNAMMKTVGETIEADGAVLMALGTHTQIDLLTTGLEPYMAKVEFEVVDEATQALIEEISKLSLRELRG